MPWNAFNRRDGRLFCEEVPLEEIARGVGTPTYVYSSAALLGAYRAYESALAGASASVHYAVKANSSLAILALLAKAGAGFDIVSGGELYRVLRAGGQARRVVFSGVGKTLQELEEGLDAGVGSFNCESGAELLLLRDLAERKGASPEVALRVNPNVDAGGHPYIATGRREHKFGVDFETAESLYRRSAELAPLRLNGVSCHIGSQIFDVRAFLHALERVLELVDRLREGGIRIERLDLGGGLGIAYAPDQEGPSIEDYGRRIVSALAGRDLRLIVEPGRSIVGGAGLLLTRVLYRKQSGEKNFFIVDAAMNDLLRPALYNSHHEIAPVCARERPEVLADVVGPVCETGDFLAKDRLMPALEPGELAAIATAGAYGFVLASNYNARPRPAEALVEGASFRQIRRRETYEDLVRGEEIP